MDNYSNLDEDDMRNKIQVIIWDEIETIELFK